MQKAPPKLLADYIVAEELTAMSSKACMTYNKTSTLPQFYIPNMKNNLNTKNKS
jgi:hypothetical protein